MRSMRSSVTLLLLLCVVAGGRLGTHAQSPLEKNPFDGNPEAILAGMGGFRQRCADCHGTDGSRCARSRHHADLVVGAHRPGSVQDDSQRRVGHGDAGVSGAANLRPRDLADAGVPAHAGRARAGRSTARQRRKRRRVCSARTALRVIESTRLAGVSAQTCRESAPPGRATCSCRGSAAAPRSFGRASQPVTITPESGPPIQGVKKNEDLFSVQIMDTRRTHPGIREGQGEIGDERDEVGDAGVWSRSSERQRARRCRSLPADVARIRPRGAAMIPRLITDRTDRGGQLRATRCSAAVVLLTCAGVPASLTAQQAPPARSRCRRFSKDCLPMVRDG